MSKNETTGRYLIWSLEHSAWWGPQRCGYTRKLYHAGRYSHAEALSICIDAVAGNTRMPGTLPELPVAEADVLMMHHIPRELGEPT